MPISDLKEPEKFIFQVRNNNKNAILFPDQNRITDFEYDAIGTFYNGRIATAQNDKWGSISFAGEVLEPFTHSGVSIIEGGDFIFY